MARSVSDIALLLDVMAGPSPLDPYSFDENRSEDMGPPLVDFKGVRIAWAPTLGGRATVASSVLDVLEPHLRLFQELGGQVEIACPDLDGADETFRTLRAAEFLAVYGTSLKEHPEAFNAFVTRNIEQGAGLSAEDVVRAEIELSRLVRSAAEFFSTYDVVLAPAAQVAPFPVGWDYPRKIESVEMHSYLDWMRAAYLFTPLGVPAISVPAGFTDLGLPVGLQILGARNTEQRLLSVARLFEQRTRFGLRRPDLVKLDQHGGGIA